MKRLEGKVFAIVGGTGGIGTALSKRVAAEGGSVLIGARNLDGAQALAEEIGKDGGRAAAERVDLGSDEEIRRFAARAEEIFGGLDAFQVNATFFSMDDSDPVDMPFEIFEKTIQVNIAGSFSCTKYAIPAMLKRGGGTMLYTSSASAHSPDARRVAYSMAKTSIHALMRHVAVRWGREGIRANVIAPGVIWHDEFERKAPQMKEWALNSSRVAYLGEPADIAAMSALLMSDEGKFVTGQVISIDGGTSMRL